MSIPNIQFSIDSGIAQITLDRPDKLNALTHALMLELLAALNEANRRDDVRVISLTGAGRAFCAGQDLSERDPRNRQGSLDLEAIQREVFHPVIRAITDTPKPVVACVNGVAAGAGAGLALAADIVLACDTAKFTFSFAKVGLSVDAGLGRTLAQTLGAQRARALLMLGGTLSATESEAAGLIWRALPQADLDEAYDTVLAQLAAVPRLAISGIKQAVAAAHLPPSNYLEVEARLQGQAGVHPDYDEGVLSFLERRPARFT